jgi:hypothetical protein
MGSTEGLAAHSTDAWEKNCQFLYRVNATVLQNDIRTILSQNQPIDEALGRVSDLCINLKGVKKHWNFKRLVGNQIREKVSELESIIIEQSKQKNSLRPHNIDWDNRTRNAGIFVVARIPTTGKLVFLLARTIAAGPRNKYKWETLGGKREQGTGTCATASNELYEESLGLYDISLDKFEQARKAHKSVCIEGEFNSEIFVMELDYIDPKTFTSRYEKFRSIYNTVNCIINNNNPEEKMARKNWSCFVEHDEFSWVLVDDFVSNNSLNFDLMDRFTQNVCPNLYLKEILYKLLPDYTTCSPALKCLKSFDDFPRHFSAVDYLGLNLDIDELNANVDNDFKKFVRSAELHYCHEGYSQKRLYIQLPANGLSSNATSSETVETVMNRQERYGDENFRAWGEIPEPR